MIKSKIINLKDFYCENFYVYNMEDNLSIQTRISALEHHLEDVRKRAKDLLTKESLSSSQVSPDTSHKIESDKVRVSENFSSSSDSFSSSEPEKSNRNPYYYPYQYPYPNYYPVYYPQQEMQQKIDYLHHQLNQNHQFFLNNEKKLKEENNNLKELLNKNSSNLKVKEIQESFSALQEKYEKIEKQNKILEQEKIEFEEKHKSLEAKYKKLKGQSYQKNENKTDLKEEGLRNEIKKLNDKISSLESKISCDKVIIDNYKKDLSKADDKIANLETSMIDSRNEYSQINKKLSMENESLKKQVNALTKSIEMKESEEITKLKLLITHKNKEIESLKQEVERGYDEEQPTPIEIRVSKRKSVPNHSQKIAKLKRHHNSVIREEDLVDESEEYENTKEDKKPSLENQLIHLQIEKQKLENEYIKMPEFSRNLASKLRKAEVETELEKVTKTISSVKNRLRSLKLI